MSNFDSGSDSEAERALREALTSRLLKRDVSQPRHSSNPNQQHSPSPEHASNSNHSSLEDGAYQSPSPHNALAPVDPASIIDEALLNPQRVSKWETSHSPERSPDADSKPRHTRKRTHGDHEHGVHPPERHPAEKHAHHDVRSRSRSSSQRKGTRGRRAGSASPEPLRTESFSSSDEELAQPDAASPVEPVTPSEAPSTAPKLPPFLPAIMGCRSVDEFECLNRIEEGTYGVVFRARDRRTNVIVALKRLKMEKEKEGFPITSLREINTLLKAQHENIVNVREIVVGASMDKIYIVMEFVEHDLRSLMESMKKPFEIGQVKTLTIQLLRAVGHLHANWILHRDLKCSNLLLSNRGMLKVGDFGLAREYGSPLKQYTPVVVTLWYRAPELLLGVKEYSTPVDLWSVGCIFAELLLMKPLWRGRHEMEELQMIFKDLGTPSERIWPGLSELPIWKQLKFTEYPYNTLKTRFASTGHVLTESGFELLNRLFTYFPAKRISAVDALEHRYWNEHPLPTPPDLFPTWPSRAELSAAAASAPGAGAGGKGAHRVNTPPPPSAGKAAAKLLIGDDDDLIVTGAAPPPFALRL